jgi:FkbM family methyltransferase
MENNSECYQLDNYHDGTPAFFYTLNGCIISSSIRNNIIWEKYLHDIFQMFLSKDSIAIECGCHIGVHTVKIAKLCKMVYGFEPMPDTNEILHKNLAINNIDNAVVFKTGVSNKPGKTKYGWIDKDNLGASGLDNNPMGKPDWATAMETTIDVELTTIDHLGLEKLDFMKIDVEGYEPCVIEGAMKTIKRCRPIIAMEVWKNHSGEIDIEYTRATFSTLLENDYEVKHIAGPDFIFLPK